MLWKQFEYVRHVLWDLDVETKEEALANGNDPAFRYGMGIIRYRDTGEQVDQRDHYLAMGRDLLPYIHQSLDEKKLTPEFVQHGGRSCSATATSPPMFSTIPTICLQNAIA